MSSTGRSGGRSAGRAAWRIAAREVRAAPLRHGLLVAMIAAAVAAAVVAAGLARTDQAAASPDLVVHDEAQLVVERWSQGVAYDQLDAAEQAEVDRRLGGPLPTIEIAEVEAALDELLPDDATVSRERESALRVTAPDGAAEFQRTIATDPGTAIGDGRFVDWPMRPLADDEVVLTARVAGRLGVDVGDEVDTELGALRVAGISLGPVGAVRHGDEVPDGWMHRWLVADLDDPTATDVSDRLQRRFEPAEQRFEPTAGSGPDTGPHGPGFAEATVNVTSSAGRGMTGMTGMVAASGPRPGIVGAVVAVALLSVVALVAGAAFATGARRRVRTFGLLAAAAGAERRHLTAIVRREGLVLGGVGAVAGAALGVLVARTLLPAARGWLGGYPVPTSLAVSDVAVPLVLAVVAAGLAAWSPARTVAAVPAATALAGRVPHRPVRRWVVPASLAALAIGTVTTAVVLRGPAVGGGLVGYSPGSWGPGASLGLRSGELRAAALTVAVGTLLVGLVGLAGPAVAALGRVAPRLPLTWRLAWRDAVRQRTRSAATVAATAVVLCLPVLVGALDTGTGTDPAPSLRPELAGRTVTIAGPTYGPLTLDAREYAVGQVADELADRIVERHRVTVLELAGSAHLAGGVGIVDADAPSPAGDHGLQDPAAAPPAPVTPAGIVTTHRTVALDAALQRLLALDDTPEALLLEPFPMYDHQLGEETTVRLRPGHLPVGARDDDGTLPPTVEVSLLRRDVPLPPTVPQLALRDDVAERLDLQPAAELVILELDRPLAEAQRRELVLRSTDTTRIEPHVDPSPTARLLVPLGTLAAGAVALVIALLAGGLAATESDRTLSRLAAVGAGRRLRPRFRAAQAATQALLGALLAVPGGLLLALAVDRGAAGPTGGVQLPLTVVALLLGVVPALVGLPMLLSRPARVEASRRPT